MATAAPRKIFINLAVDDLQRSIDFFTKLGFGFNAQFTDETSTCMVISDEAYAMIMTKEKFSGFTKKALIDSSKHVEALFALSCDSREEVDELANIALANGGAEDGPSQDHGFMYGRSFTDPDGHTWELVWMDPEAVQQ